MKYPVKKTNHRSNIQDLYLQQDKGIKFLKFHLKLHFQGKSDELDQEPVRAQLVNFQISFYRKRSITSTNFYLYLFILSIYL